MVKMRQVSQGQQSNVVKKPSATPILHRFAVDATNAGHLFHFLPNKSDLARWGQVTLTFKRGRLYGVVGNPLLMLSAKLPKQLGGRTVTVAYDHHVGKYFILSAAPGTAKAKAGKVVARGPFEVSSGFTLTERMLEEWYRTFNPWFNARAVARAEDQRRESFVFHGDGE